MPQLLMPKRDKSATRIAHRNAQAAAARQLQAAARDSADADKASGKRGRKVPGPNAFAFLTGPAEKLG